MQHKILITGACGQIGRELIDEFDAEDVVASDIRPNPGFKCIYEELDVLDMPALAKVMKKHQIKEVYHLAAMLSATAELSPARGWKLNMEGLFNLLELMRDIHGGKLFWPSSIAVFGNNTPKETTPQYTIMEPTTIYGISKLAGERWCEYYHLRYGIDVRSIRYPGLIGYKSEPGGGTTDYAVTIFHSNSFECFLKEDTMLPMMYMPDALRATLALMDAPENTIRIRSGYNLAAFSFTPAMLAAEIKKHIPEFHITYKPDSRQTIADSWPHSIDDTYAREHWGWYPEYSLESMTKDMLLHLNKIH